MWSRKPQHAAMRNLPIASSAWSACTPPRLRWSGASLRRGRLEAVKDTARVIIGQALGGLLRGS